MSSKQLKNISVKLEISPKELSSMKVTFDSKESRQHYRSNPNELIILVNSFTAGLCINLGEDKYETNLYFAMLLDDIETCIERSKK